MEKYKYDLGIEVTENILLFKNRTLMHPGKDYILKSDNKYFGEMSVIFKFKLVDQETLTVFTPEYNTVFYFKYNEEEDILVDESTDKPGFINRYFEWI